MHGFYYLVADVDWRRRAVTLATNRQFAFAVGDLLTFYADSTAHLGTVPIASMESVDDPLPAGTTSNQMTSLSYDDADYMKVEHASGTSSIACMACAAWVAMKPQEQWACMTAMHMSRTPYTSRLQTRSPRHRPAVRQRVITSIVLWAMAGARVHPLFCGSCRRCTSLNGQRA